MEAAAMDIFLKKDNPKEAHSRYQPVHEETFKRPSREQIHNVHGEDIHTVWFIMKE